MPPNRIAAPPNRIALLRETASLSKADLAWRMNVSTRTVYRWEAGRVEIGDEQKLALSSLFNVPVGYLMGWDQPHGGERLAS